MNFPPDFVIFDCDGVLVDSEPLSNVVLLDNLARHGLTISIEEVEEYFVGGTLAGVMTTARQMGATLPDDWLDCMYSEIFTVLEAEVEPVPGIGGVLDALDAAGVGYAVGSNGPHRKMEITLTRTGLLPRLEGRIYSREDVAQPKPAPDVYLKAAADAGVSPERCSVIEDSPSGARAGKAAGMYCLGYIAQTDSARLEPICDALFSRMQDLPGMLGLRPGA